MTELFMKKNKVKFIIIGFVLCFLLVLKIYFFDNIFLANRFGKSANYIRLSIQVPIIEPSMQKVRSVNRNEYGGKWEEKNDKKMGLIHLWKIVSPNSGDYILYEELDMFRKYLNSENYWQLNMNSKMLGDSISKRSGILGFYQKKMINNYQLGENGLDSLFSDWRLDKLVKGNISK